MSVCSTVRFYHLCSHWTDIREIPHARLSLQIIALYWDSRMKHTNALWAEHIFLTLRHLHVVNHCAPSLVLIHM